MFTVLYLQNYDDPGVSMNLEGVSSFSTRKELFEAIRLFLGPLLPKNIIQQIINCGGVVVKEDLGSPGDCVWNTLQILDTSGGKGIPIINYDNFKPTKLPLLTDLFIKNHKEILKSFQQEVYVHSFKFGDKMEDVVIHKYISNNSWWPTWFNSTASRIKKAEELMSTNPRIKIPETIIWLDDFCQEVAIRKFIPKGMIKDPLQFCRKLGEVIAEIHSIKILPKHDDLWSLGDASLNAIFNEYEFPKYMRSTLKEHGEPVFLHGDCYTDNFIYGEDSNIYIIDLEEAALGPRELDLVEMITCEYVKNIDSGAQTILDSYKEVSGICFTNDDLKPWVDFHLEFIRLSMIKLKSS